MDMAKPEGCLGCPFYQTGRGFVPDRLVPGAKLLILAQNPGANEEQGEEIIAYSGGHGITKEVEPQPLIGATGYILKKTYLPLAGLRHEEVSYANVIKCRVNRKNDLPGGDAYEKAVAHCTSRHLTIPPAVTRVVAMGGHAINHTQGHEACQVGDWRGYPLPARWHEREVYAVEHLANTFKSNETKLEARSDWRRLGQYLRGSWPLPEPVRGDTWWVVPHDLSVGEACASLLALSSIPVYLDTEYLPDNAKPWLSHLTLIGLLFGDNVLQFDWPALNTEERAHVAAALRHIASHCKVVLQNAAADLPILEHTCLVSREAWRDLEDTLLAHAELWSELNHGMDYLSSFYGVLAQPKSARKGNDFYRYNMGDLLETRAIWLALQQELSRCPKAATWYKTHRIPLIHITTRAQERGLAVNTMGWVQAKAEYQARADVAAEVASHYIGYPINVGSNSQMVQALTEVGGLSLRRGKHTKSLSIEKEAVAEMRSKIHPEPDLEREGDQGLEPEEALARIEEGAHPLLEARVIYATATSALDDFLHPIEGQDHVHPRCKLYAQASHRWSWVEPPMQNVPDDLIHLYGPDEGYWWFGWDWRGQEDWFHAAEFNDLRTLEGLRGNLDLHTIKARDLFGLPADAVIDKKGMQREFAKRYRHRMKFGGTVDGLKTMPLVKSLGLKEQDLMRIMARDAMANPRYNAVRKKRAADLMANRYDLYQDVVTHEGRFRRTLEQGGRLLRVGLNASQGCGADQLDATVVSLAAMFPREQVQLAYSAHDSVALHVRRDMATEETFRAIKQVVEAPIEAFGHTLLIPGDFWVQRGMGQKREEWK